MFEDIQHIECRVNETGNARIARFTYMGEKYNFFAWMGDEPYFMASCIMGPGISKDVELFEGTNYG